MDLSDYGGGMIGLRFVFGSGRDYLRILWSSDSSGVDSGVSFGDIAVRSISESSSSSSQLSNFGFGGNMRRLYIIIGGTCGGFLVLIILVLLVVLLGIFFIHIFDFWARKKKQNRKNSGNEIALEEQIQKRNSFGIFVIKYSDIEIISKIGEGSFGEVFRSNISWIFLRSEANISRQMLLSKSSLLMPMSVLLNCWKKQKWWGMWLCFTLVPHIGNCHHIQTLFFSEE